MVRTSTTFAAALVGIALAVSAASSVPAGDEPPARPDREPARESGPVEASPQPESGTSSAVLPLINLNHVDARIAALLMSGQRGGVLDGVLSVGVPEVVGDGRQLPIWVELDLGPLTAEGQGGATALELYAYVLDLEGDVESFHAWQLSLAADELPENAPNGLRFFDELTVSARGRELRFLAFDRDSDRFYVDSRPIFGTEPDQVGAAAIVVFPDDGDGWVEARAAATERDAGILVGRARLLPAGRPVLQSPADVELFIITSGTGRSDPVISGRLVGTRGRQHDAGGFDVIDHLTTAVTGLVAYRVRWSIPVLPPDRYALEVTLSTDVTVTADAQLLALPPEQAAGHRTWTTFLVDASQTRMPVRVDPRLSYVDGLHLLADGEWSRAVEAVYGIENRALEGRQDAAGSGVPDIFELEGSLVHELLDRAPASIVPLMMLHHDVLARSLREGNSLVAQHSLRILAAISRETLRQRELGESAAAAGAILASAADALHAPGASERSLAVLDLACELDPDHQAAHLGVAVIHEWLGHYEAVVEALRGVGMQPGGLPEVRLRLGINLFRIGRERNAIQELEGCIDDDSPEWVRIVAEQELAVIHLDAGRPGEAGKVIERARSLFPHDSGLLILQARIAEAMGDPAAVRKILEPLDQQALSSYRESPRRRYSRWPSEVFGAERSRAKKLAIEHLPDLAGALQALPQDETP